jgi:shikimate dehydrogenase
MKDVYELSDLQGRDLLDHGAHKPARLAVLGRPISHSVSPGMHQRALDALGMDLRYIRLDVGAGELPEVMERMAALGFTGCNVTLPHKVAVAGLCSWLDPVASLAGAVNTVAFADDGLRGWNTDVPGFASAVGECFGRGLAGRSVLLAGAGGGAGQAVAVACAVSGAARLVLVNRTLSKAGDLAARLGGVAPGMEIELLGSGDPGLGDRARECDLLVNATSLGLRPEDPPVLPDACFRGGQDVYDLVYRKGGTRFLGDAASRGCRVADGLPMLLHQGALAFRIWFPGSEPLEHMRGYFA